MLDVRAMGLSFEEICMRLIVATLVGGILGLDRELRGISAGIRTHGLASLSSAAITASALMLHAELSQHGSASTDPLRVVQGLAQAIGFIAAGVIFVARGDVRNVTSAATIWLAATLGIVAGAGQYALLGVATLLGILLVSVVRIAERYLPHDDKKDEP